MSGVESKIHDFIENNEDLITQYENIETSLPLEYCCDEIINSYNNLLKVNKNIDFTQSLKEALYLSIKYNQNILDSYESLILENVSEDSSTNSTQQYFKEINDIYTKNNNNYDIEYCPENRDKLIEMNLKTVISIAKKYQGLGLSLSELISAGNLGLVVAWDKFDPNKSKLKDNVLECISKLNDTFTYQELEECIKQYLTYGDIKKKFIERFSNHDQVLTKKEVVKWANVNLYNAKFNSVATMWISAYIRIEIDNNSRIVKKPKAEIYKDKERDGVYKKEITIDIDAPISDDSDTCISDILYIEDDAKTDLDVSEAYNIFKSGLNQLLDGVKPRDRRVFLKKFGIGLPRPMTPKEIAEQEDLSIARISQIFQTVIEAMQRNQVKYNINSDVLFDAIKKIQ